MKIGVPKEIKPQENRIGLTPESVKTLVSEGHEVIVENNGGFEAGFENEHYTNAGAKIASTASDIFIPTVLISKQDGEKIKKYLGGEANKYDSQKEFNKNVDVIMNVEFDMVKK